MRGGTDKEAARGKKVVEQVLREKRAPTKTERKQVKKHVSNVTRASRRGR